MHVWLSFGHTKILKAFAMVLKDPFTLYIHIKSKQNALSWQHIGHIGLSFPPIFSYSIKYIII